MIGHIYRLMDTKRIEMVQREVKFGCDDVIIKPDYLSICAADQRYYFGKRSKEVLQKKLPMALIHEATATVLFDKSGKFSKNSKVVVVPLIETVSSEGVKANYNPKNIFVSSGYDGFMQEIMAVGNERIIPINNEYSVIYVFTEIVSVAINAAEAFERANKTFTESFGIWGDGNLGFVMSLVLRCLYPDSKIYVFGKNLRKLQHFSFADKTYIIDDVPKNIKIDHCFECVGGTKSSEAISQMIDMISPQGCISLLGVSENPIPINTRSVLDKGLIFIGNSRSSKEDFIKAVNLIDNNAMCRKYLKMLISQIICVKDENDMVNAFEQSILNDYKTVMKWEV